MVWVLYTRQRVAWHSACASPEKGSLHGHINPPNHRLERSVSSTGEWMGSAIARPLSLNNVSQRETVTSTKEDFEENDAKEGQSFPYHRILEPVLSWGTSWMRLTEHPADQGQVYLLEHDASLAGTPEQCPHSLAAREPAATAGRNCVGMDGQQALTPTRSFSSRTNRQPIVRLSLTTYCLTTLHSTLTDFFLQCSLHLRIRDSVPGTTFFQLGQGSLSLCPFVGLLPLSRIYTPCDCSI